MKLNFTECQQPKVHCMIAKLAGTYTGNRESFFITDTRLYSRLWIVIMKYTCFAIDSHQPINFKLLVLSVAIGHTRPLW